jgi:flagellar secretion chaperone FliS
MRNKRYQESLDDEVLSADPVRLIQMLYRGAVDSITTARRCLKLGDIRARSRAISKAMAIVTELSLSLNHTTGGDLSKNLAELYAYAEKLLIQANREQSDPPLAEAERLLTTLLEAWENCIVADKPSAVNEARAEDGGPYRPVSCAY